MTVPSYVATEAAQAVRAAADAIATPAAQALSARADSAVHDGAALAASLVAAVAEVESANRLEALAEDGVTLPAVAETTANRRIQAKNQTAIVDLVRSAAVVQYARRSARESFTDRESAIDRRARTGELLDDRSAGADGATFTAFRALRSAVSTHVRQVADGLPRVSTSSPAAILPSLTLAYSIYGGIGRAGEIAARNRLPRPGFVPARPIEVLT